MQEKLNLNQVLAKINECNEKLEEAEKKITILLKQNFNL